MITKQFEQMAEQLKAASAAMAERKKLYDEAMQHLTKEKWDLNKAVEMLGEAKKQTEIIGKLPEEIKSFNDVWVRFLAVRERIKRRIKIDRMFKLLASFEEDDRNFIIGMMIKEETKIKFRTHRSVIKKFATKYLLIEGLNLWVPFDFKYIKFALIMKDVIRKHITVEEFVRMVNVFKNQEEALGAILHDKFIYYRGSKFKIENYAKSEVKLARLDKPLPVDVGSIKEAMEAKIGTIQGLKIPELIKYVKKYGIEEGQDLGKKLAGINLYSYRRNATQIVDYRVEAGVPEIRIAHLPSYWLKVDSNLGDYIDNAHYLRLIPAFEDAEREIEEKELFGAKTFDQLVKAFKHTDDKETIVTALESFKIDKKLSEKIAKIIDFAKRHNISLTRLRKLEQGIKKAEVSG